MSRLQTIFIIIAIEWHQLHRTIPLSQRYWLKANVWVAIFSYVGNYFWTHYFYQVLGASYSFPVRIELNRVPFFLYLVTHGYFAFYLTASTILLRRIWTSALYLKSSSLVRLLISILVVFGFSVITAFMETYTINEVLQLPSSSSFNEPRLAPLMNRALCHHRAGSVLLSQGQVDDVHGRIGLLWHLLLCGLPNVLSVPQLYTCIIVVQACVSNSRCQHR